MCRAQIAECAVVGLAKRAAEAWSIEQEPGGVPHGPQDAMRHAKWSAEISRALGPATAKAWGDAHELSSPDPAETRMDLHNNAEGRDIESTWTDINAGIWNARTTGRLCLNKGAC